MFLLTMEVRYGAFEIVSLCFLRFNLERLCVSLVDEFENSAAKPVLLVSVRFLLFVHGCFWHRINIEKAMKKHLRSKHYLRSRSSVAIGRQKRYAARLERYSRQINKGIEIVLNIDWSRLKLHIIESQERLVEATRAAIQSYMEKLGETQ